MNIKAIMNEASKKKNYMIREGGASQEEILALEGHYEITLPDDYRQFLQTFGFALWFGEYVCGLVEETTKFRKSLDVYKKTDYYRKFYNDSGYQAVPRNGVIVNKYDGGGYYFLFSKESERAGEVGLFLTETFGQEVSSFTSFTDYLSFLVTGSPDPVLANVDYEKINNILEK